MKLYAVTMKFPHASVAQKLFVTKSSMEKSWLTRKTLCLPKDHRQSIEKEVKIYNPSELSSKLLYLCVERLGRRICCTVDKIVEYFIFPVTYSVGAVLKESLAKALTLSYHFCMLSYAEIHVDLVLLNIMRRECTIEYASLRSG